MGIEILAQSVSALETDSTFPPTAWSAVGSMALCVALLIAAEFMPVSLLTPIANDLHATPGMAGQAISISGLFAIMAGGALGGLLLDRTSITGTLLGGSLLLLLATVVVGNGHRLRPQPQT